jgi:hypothetical protein
MKFKKFIVGIAVVASLALGVVVVFGDKPPPPPGGTITFSQFLK